MNAGVRAVYEQIDRLARAGDREALQSFLGLERPITDEQLANLRELTGISPAPEGDHDSFCTMCEQPASVCVCR
jgi:hypothetical protein